MSIVAVWWKKLHKIVLLGTSFQLSVVAVLLEIGCGRSIYTTETSKRYLKQGCVCFHGWLANTYQHSTSVGGLE